MKETNYQYFMKKLIALERELYEFDRELYTKHVVNIVRAITRPTTDKYDEALAILDITSLLILIKAEMLTITAREINNVTAN